MLTNETKRRIDNCRDILVGKLPDPKSQVEQITIALIYKFMDDMDRESEELGGVAKFFVGDFSRYKWANIMDKKSSGFERLNLYAEGIEKMTQNTSIPQLFRDIFKNAFLPYRDPETFNLFSKEINGFSYEHSEELGNAFEYLLSIMSSQGDAGQFRTPRHIIDFIVEVVEPKKNETILDPACGTAGFLISAYKYIQDKNKENELNPDEQERLTKNISGYDISPDMVRLSLVNLYLHSFPEPQIYEYDTLTSEDRWKDNFDVILANPPFMTPKGGIKPHSKFAIKANRSEVLFVDYIMEHININGRAGVIVPEGIIFQSANAYKSLRKKLIDDKYLWAVVSLPAGVFNPYSGVKTSILLMDREIAKKTDKILFVKVENDGYDLGAQRRKIDKDNLGEAIELLRGYRECVFATDEERLTQINDNEMAVVVEKNKIAENGDYNLSMDRYKEIVVHKHKDWEMVELGEVLEYEQPTKYIVNKVDYSDEFKTPVLTAGKSFILGYTDETDNIFSENLPVIIFDDFTTDNKFVDFPFKVKSSAMKILKPISDKVNIKFAYYLIQKIEFNSDTHKRYWISQYSKIKIPLPPLSVQKEIVEEIEGYQKIIDGARAIVENWKPVVKIDKDWEMVELGEVAKLKGGYAFKSEDFIDNGVQVIKMGNVKDGYFDYSNRPSYLPNSFLEKYDTYVLNKGDILISMTGTVGKTDYGNVCKIDIDEKFFLNQRVGKFEIIEEQRIILNYLYEIAKTAKFKEQIFNNSTGGVRQANISSKQLEQIIIPLPDIKIQEKIVAEIEEEKKIVEANKRLIEIYEQKIKDKIAEVWGE